MRRRSALALALAAALHAPARGSAAPDRRAGLRIVSIGSSVTEIVYALGAEELLVGVDTTSLYPEAARKLPQVGYMRSLSAEGILSLKPNLVIATTAAGPAAAFDLLRATGIEVLLLPDHYTFESVITKIEAVGRVTGRVALADELIARGRAEMELLAARLASATRRPRVLSLLSMAGGAPQAAGRDTAADGIIRLAGGVNAIDGYAGYRPLTPEAAIASAAEYVLVTRHTVDRLGGIQAVLDQPALRQMPAGKAGRVLQFDTLLLLGFGPRTPQAASQLAAALHPEPARAR